MVHSWATDTDDATVMPRWKVGKQKIEDTGPLTRDRMPGVVVSVSNPDRSPVGINR